MLTLKVGNHKEIPAEFYGSPKEIWGFHVPRARGKPVAVGRRFIADNQELFKHDGIHDGFVHRKTLESLGASHVIFEQHHLGVRIHRAYITVHIGPEGRVYMAKNRATPANLLPNVSRFVITTAAARRTARGALSRRSGSLRAVRDVEQLWYPRGKKLRPAYKFRFFCESPPGDWIVYVDAEKNTCLEKLDNLALRQRLATVFDPNPVVALGTGWKVLLDDDGELRPPPVTTLRVVELTGLDRSGFLDGRRVTTSPTPSRVRRSDGRFQCPPSDPAFAECMAYFHVSRAMDYLEDLGFKGARRVRFKLPLGVNVRATSEDNSFYDPGLKQLQFGTGGAVDSHDAEVILHEFGHALQDAIVPDFGQRREGWAIGEGFGDYFAASFFAHLKHPDHRTRIMGWDGLPDSDADPPFFRRVDSRKTRNAFDKKGDEHDNGEIWSAVLWDIHEALGREIADTIIIESHFQLDGFADFARAVRAILDADRNVYKGEHLDRLRRIFRRRRFVP